MLTKEIEALGYQVRDYVPSFTTEELESYYADAKTCYWPVFCKQIHIPGDDGSMMKALLNVPNDSRYSWAFESGHNHILTPDDGVYSPRVSDLLEVENR